MKTDVLGQALILPHFAATGDRVTGQCHFTSSATVPAERNAPRIEGRCIRAHFDTFFGEKPKVSVNGNSTSTRLYRSPPDTFKYPATRSETCRVGCWYIKTRYAKHPAGPFFGSDFDDSVGSPLREGPRLSPETR